MRDGAGSESTAARTVIELVRERIASGEFAPMSRLPRETELAANLGVSRSALREAIRALELVGVLRSKHGSGTFVTALEPSDLLQGLAYSNGLLNAESAVELVEFRRLIEPGACALAARRATPAQKAEIRRRYEEMEQVEDPLEYARLDPLFHRSILEASGNSVLFAASTALTYGSAWQKMWRAVTRDVVPERTRREHEYLVLAIERGDVDLALATAHAHIGEAQARIADSLDRGLQP